MGEKNRREQRAANDREGVNLGDRPVEPKYRAQMAAIAKTLDEFLNGDARGADRETGFVVLMFPFGADLDVDARCNFLSNGADRKDIVALFKEMIARFEGQAEPPTGNA